MNVIELNRKRAIEIMKTEIAKDNKKLLNDSLYYRELRETRIKILKDELEYLEKLTR